jgi:RNA polymerase sigma-70 factor (ECF subfamily)
MLRAWASRKQFEPGSNLKAWTFRILRNLFVSQRRRARFVGEFDEGDAERKLAQGETQSGAVQLTELALLLEQLPATQQHALRMIAIESLSYEEAAGRAGVSVGTMKNRVHRAREALKALVNGRPQAEQVGVTVDGAQASPTRAAPSNHEGDLRRAWAEAKAAGRPFLIG